MRQPSLCTFAMVRMIVCARTMVTDMYVCKLANIIVASLVLFSWRDQSVSHFAKGLAPSARFISFCHDGMKKHVILNISTVQQDHHSHSLMYTQTHTHTHTHTQTHTCTHGYTSIHMCTQTHTHTYAHTDTHTYAHTLICICLLYISHITLSCAVMNVCIHTYYKHAP